MMVDQGGEKAKEIMQGKKKRKIRPAKKEGKGQRAFTAKKKSNTEKKKKANRAS